MNNMEERTKTILTWSIAKEQDLGELISFLKKQEENCVAFTSRLIYEDGPSLPIKRKARIFIAGHEEEQRKFGEHNRGDIKAAVYQSSQGFIYPVFHPETREEIKDQPKSFPPLKRFFPGIRSIMGLRENVELIEFIAGKKVSEYINYFLMSENSLETPSIPTQAPPAMRIRLAGPEDVKAIFPIQEKYEREEVLLREDSFDAASSMYHLRILLEREIILIAELNGKVIAKAGTNARGFHYDQIGGVFTEAKYRNRGIACLLMQRLLAILHDQGKKACLFVKKTNPSAIALYQKLSFDINNEFRISYYNW